MGGWGALLVEAGYPAYNPPWDREEAIEALRAYSETFGCAPGKEDLDSQGDSLYPSAATVRRLFGSFSVGLRAAGFEPRRRPWPREAAVEAARRYRHATGRWPRSRDWTRASEQWPCSGHVTRLFGSWPAFVAAAQLEPSVSSVASG